MQINITGRQIETGAALREHVEARLTGAVEKYFNRPADVNVVFSRQGYGYEANCSLHLDSGLYLNATGSHADIYNSFDQSVERIEKQLRRYKRRLKNHHDQNSRNNGPEMFAERVIEPETVSEQMPEEFAPVIIAENDRVLPQLSVSEAVMQLELGDTPFVLFKTRARDNLNLVHRRTDGNIGWMELDAAG
ncbi:MAG: ribosomal subunit interface protein [Rhizobiales bacterium TMED143]|nr:ribosomal subunit interface protein [Rhodobiaceae bacterium]MBL6787460.1 ribosome-associated translation inhibitor RaiA [PS1 clade bacterium]OUV92197.1 MAG: ribosomal subunit interface protein [Rhizobiales bacterium TMED143]CAI8317380.1 MAG: Ribosome hibernation promotion factor [Rhodobiaceae bacterium UBA7378]HCQ82931.1 ribosome-associated translation inhibitor RaiA [Rhodobiaceae bacterium]|tara:strand:+ start:1629 stop:2201 length:573 start_codon:yes stop_codon:yes gene_type:complete